MQNLFNSMCLYKWVKHNKSEDLKLTNNFK